jgi:hypothetical protein
MQRRSDPDGSNRGVAVVTSHNVGWQDEAGGCASWLS